MMNLVANNLALRCEAQTGDFVQDALGRLFFVAAIPGRESRGK